MTDDFFIGTKWTEELLCMCTVHTHTHTHTHTHIYIYIMLESAKDKYQKAMNRNSFPKII